MSTERHTGRLLIAAPVLEDPNFHRTVILMIEHGDEGALGLVLNRPTGIELDSALPGWASVAAAPPVVFVGGPVAPESAIGLARRSGTRDGGSPPGPAAAAARSEGPGGGAGFSPVVGRIGTVDLSRAPADIAPGVWGARVFAGYAGWGPGQLEGELAVGGWIVADADEADVVASDPDQLWRRVLRRQPGRTSWLANFPPSPRMN